MLFEEQLPDSTAAAALKIFIVEPGSNGSVMILFLHNFCSKPPNVLGLKRGECAMANMAPVLVAITMAIPDLAEDSITASSSAFSVIYWTVLSMVRIRLLPL